MFFVVSNSPIENDYAYLLNDVNEVKDIIGDILSDNTGCTVYTNLKDLPARVLDIFSYTLKHLFIRDNNECEWRKCISSPLKYYMFDTWVKICDIFRVPHGITIEE